MVFCCAVSCNSNSSKADLDNRITFHRFPEIEKDPQRHQIWLTNIGRQHFSATKATRICSKHFIEECFDKLGQTTRLNKDAVPTLFELNCCLNKKRKARFLVQNSLAEQELTKKKKCEPTSSNFNSRPILDHKYSITDSPRKIKTKLENQIKTLKNKLKHCQTSNSKYKKSITSFKGILRALKKKSLLSNDLEQLLESSVTGIPNVLMFRLLKKKSNKYPKEIRSFAMTLQFYSPKAYNYVRQSLHFCLPHPSVIRKWYASVSGEPGFTEEVFAALKSKVLSGEKVICSLLMDEMAIRKHVEWDGKKFRGFVDIGTNIDDDCVPEASDAFVLMLVGINASWKAPCGYFLVNGLTGEEKANIITTCIVKLHDIGIIVKSLTCDGPCSNTSMLRTLGANISNISNSFFFTSKR